MRFRVIFGFMVAALLVVGSMIGGAAAQGAELTEQEIAEGWISLCDGTTLFGWQPHSEANWKVVDGALTADEGAAGLLCTTVPFANYTLRLEFLAEANTNSGVFLRTAPVIAKEDLTTQCYELNIAGDDNPFPTGSLVERQKAPPGCQDSSWRQFEVTLRGGEIRVVYQGRELYTYRDPKPLGRGLIGLQFRQGKIAFRNIHLKPLDLTPLFNGRDLAGWKTYPDMASKFTVTPKGELNVQNGKGQLESTGQYDDFLLRFDCLTHAPLLNSGMFFRCVPGEQMNGYECQIHNGFKNEDRNVPVDCGTGGIYRRVNARRVVADDQKWFTTTLVAAGPQIAAWVNGYQVTNWTDTRPADANPRKGLRTAAGTFMIQGHDPTTNISFRNLEIQALPPR
jgi:hypothetical protein